MRSNGCQHVDAQKKSHPLFIVQVEGDNRISIYAPTFSLSIVSPTISQREAYAGQQQWCPASLFPLLENIAMHFTWSVLCPQR